MLRSARFTPDGKTIVYGAAWGGPPVKLHLVRVESPDSTPLALPPAELFALSKSGEMAISIGHEYTGWIGEGTLARAPVLGGSARETLEHVRAADWSPDGSELAIVRRVDGVDRLEYPPGKVLYTTPGYLSDAPVLAARGPDRVRGPSGVRRRSRRSGGGRSGGEQDRPGEGVRDVPRTRRGRPAETRCGSPPASPRTTWRFGRLMGRAAPASCFRAFHRSSSST